MTFLVLKAIAMFLSGVLNVIIASEERLKPPSDRRAWRPWFYGIAGVSLIGMAGWQGFAII